jgi:hypothetical protein
MRIAVSSHAYAECLQNSFGQQEPLATPDGTLNLGPYVACSADPSTPDAATILTQTQTANSPRISCNYSDIGTSRAGYAGVGGVALGDNVTPEQIALGSELADFQGATGPCYSNPLGGPCVSDITYGWLGGTLLHEMMHQHGYNHIEYSTPFYTCGINGTFALPDGETGPVYANSVPYIVQECIGGLMDQSSHQCSMHACDRNGLRLVKSVYAPPGDDSSCECVEDPQPGAQPLPPAPGDTSGGPIQCYVSTTDSNGTGWAGPSSMFLFNPANGLNSAFCIPDGSPSGLCGSALGGCTAADGRPIQWVVFDDYGVDVATGYTITAQDAGGGYFNACISTGGSTPVCRKWVGSPFGFDATGQPVYASGCIAADDWSANSVSSQGVLLSSSSVCVPDGTPSGSCRKWFGSCSL